MENKIESNSRSNFISFAKNPVKQKPSHYHSWHGLRTLNEAPFWLWQTNLADKFWGIWGIFGQTISTHFDRVSPLTMFSIIQPLFLQLNLCQKLFFLLNMGRTCFVQKLFWMSETISSHNMFSPCSSLKFSCIELVIQWIFLG